MLARIGKFGRALAALALVLLAAAPAMAQGELAPGAEGGFLSVKAMALFAAAFAIGVGTISTALGQGNAIAKAMEAIGRNPEAAGDVRTSMILGVAFAEAIAIYALVTALIIKFV